MPKDVSKQTIMNSVALYTFFLFLIINFFPIDPPNQIIFASTDSISQKQVTSNVPTHLDIPTIHLSAVVGSVGLTPEGEMGVPVGPDTTAWFDLGVHPGEVGTAVIDGHSGWKDGIPAVFDNLNQLKIGDLIYVLETNGTTITFVVRTIETYDKNADTSNIFTSTDGIAHLNLITCTGVWNEVTKSSSERLVVFADEK